MDWFGSTLYGTGPTSPISDMMRPDYQEPSCDLSLEERTKISGGRTAVLDCYIERADGYSYGSHERLQMQRLRGLTKRVGPTDMYNYPGAASMEYGWFLQDPELENKTWYRPPKSFGLSMTEISKFLEFALQSDKFFKL